jgi:RNA polymerase sigma factor (sigma-70 family)
MITATLSREATRTRNPRRRACPPVQTPLTNVRPPFRLHPTEPENDEVALLARVRSGDEAAARSLILRLYPTVLRSVHCRLPARTACEDLVQTIFSKIFRNLGQFSGRVPLEHWVSRIAINTCLSQIQYEAIRPELRMSDLSEEEEAVVQQLATDAADTLPAQGKNVRDVLNRLLSDLKPEERLVITLLHLEERVPPRSAS